MSLLQFRLAVFIVILQNKLICLGPFNRVVCFINELKTSKNCTGK